MKKPLRHIFDYLVLCFIFSISLVLLIYFNGNPKYQMPVILVTSFFYILWGYLHHRKEGDFHPNIFLEYILYSLLGGVLILGLI